MNNIAPTRWTWQGQTHSSFEVRKRHLPELRAIWRKTFGAGGQPSALEFLEGHLIGERWDQPYVQLQPWAFAPRPRVVDAGRRLPPVSGLRRHARCHRHRLVRVAGDGYRLYDSASVRIPYRAPMLRAIPVHRPTLALGLTELSI